MVARHRTLVHSSVWPTYRVDELFAPPTLAVPNLTNITFLKYDDQLKYLGLTWLVRHGGTVRSDLVGYLKLLHCHWCV